MQSMWRAILPCVVAIVWTAAPAHALKFEPVDSKLLPPGVTSALWVRDCGRLGFGDQNCPEEQKGFSQGDSGRLSRELSGRRYDEIWLASNGGNLDEGIKIGELLRSVQATVRVPPRQACISACTVAFLGGLFRYIDLEKGATYQVHAASSYSKVPSGSAFLSAVVKDPEVALPELTAEEARDTRELAHRLFVHFLKALHPLGQLPPGREGATLQQLRALPAAQSAYRGSSQLATDAQTIRREGGAAAQEILMRIERDSMDQAIEELRSLLPVLGNRSGPALNILETMYSSRILGTSSLSYETLLQMGFITKLFDPAKP
jgi:hypothetical protein